LIIGRIFGTNGTVMNRQTHEVRRVAIVTAKVGQLSRVTQCGAAIRAGDQLAVAWRHVADALASPAPEMRQQQSASFTV
jgi:hypothetical protein